MKRTNEMRTIYRSLGMAMSFCALLALVSGQALAQRGGSGGGGGGSTTTTNVAPPLIYDFAAAVNGVIPSWSGDFTITNSIPGYYSFAVVSINIKAKPLNLPDGTPIRVTAYMSDQVTGQPLPSINVVGMTVTSKVGVLKSKTIITNYSYATIVQQLDSVVISTLDGTIIATCHP
jgi:hypothetical protein